MSSSNVRAPWRGQFSAAGVCIGCVGCVIITASSVYTALKMGALPWPTIFTSITALALLRGLGRTSLNEANVTQIIMSAGSMVAGGLAFTIPGAWMLGLADKFNWVEMLAVALAGALLGLVCTALIRRRFVEESDLEFPVGTAAAKTLTAGRAGGAVSKRLFGSMAASGIWCALRDIVGVVPSMLFALPVPGVAFGLYNSPMLISVGFLVGGAAVAFWLLGGIIANFGITVGGTAAGLWSVADAQGIVSSFGMGLMMGSGVGVAVHDILPKALWHLHGTVRRGRRKTDGNRPAVKRDAGIIGLLVAAAALIACFALGLSPAICIVLVLLTFVTAIMSAQAVGQTGVDPMEIFGLIVLLAVAALGESDQVKLFFVAGVVAVACGLAGDVMSDFKTGKLIGTDPRSMWVGQAIGALLGAAVSVAVLLLLFNAYGADAFGNGRMFVSAQASVVATMISGIPSVSAFALGLVAGVALHCLGFPSMMLGLGVYLPFYMTLSAAIGAGLKWLYDRLGSRGSVEAHEEMGIVTASGVLGGESIVGVGVALMTAIGGLLG